MAIIQKRQLLYFPSLVFGAVLLFLKGAVYAALLDVTSFGQLSKLFLIISLLASFGALGMQLLGHKVLPMYYARHDYEQVADLLLSSTFIYLSVSLTVGVIASIAGLVWRSDLVAQIWLVVLVGISQFGAQLLLIDMKSRLNFLGNANVSTLRAFGLLVAGSMAAWLFHDLRAVLTAETFINVLITILIMQKSSMFLILRQYFNIKMALAWTEQHFKHGLKLLLLSISTIALFSVDKWSGFIILSNKQYGIYALGLVVLTTFEMLQRMVNVASYPTMSHLVGNGDYRAAYKIAIIAVTMVMGVTIILYYPGTLIVNYLIDHYLDKYSNAKAVIDILAVAGIIRLADFFTSYCILCNQELLLSKLQISLTIVAVMSLFLLQHMRIVNITPILLAFIALGTSIANIFTSILLSIWINAKHKLIAASV